jgi:beta-glucosidase
MTLSRAANVMLGAASLAALLSSHGFGPAAAQTAGLNAEATPGNWPARAATVIADPAVETRVDALLAASGRSSRPILPV